MNKFHVGDKVRMLTMKELQNIANETNDSIENIFGKGVYLSKSSRWIENAWFGKTTSIKSIKYGCGDDCGDGNDYLLDLPSDFDHHTSCIYFKLCEELDIE